MKQNFNRHSSKRTIASRYIELLSYYYYAPINITPVYSILDDEVLINLKELCDFIYTGKLICDSRYKRWVTTNKMKNITNGKNYKLNMSYVVVYDNKGNPLPKVTDETKPEQCKLYKMVDMETALKIVKTYCKSKKRIDDFEGYVQYVNDWFSNDADDVIMNASLIR